MIVYFDTSSLVKLYVEETHAENVREWAGEAELVATCRVACPETVSAFNRRFRAGDISRRDYKVMSDGFLKDWKKYVVIEFDEIEAAELVEKHGLRGFDAAHLSSAKKLKQVADAVVFFSSFDEKLNKAAVSEGLDVLEP